MYYLRIRIRVRYPVRRSRSGSSTSYRYHSLWQCCGYGSTPKCHGSATLVYDFYCTTIRPSGVPRGDAQVAHASPQPPHASPPPPGIPPPPGHVHPPPPQPERLVMSVNLNISINCTTIFWQLSPGLWIRIVLMRMQIRIRIQLKIFTRIRIWIQLKIFKRIRIRGGEGVGQPKMCNPLAKF